jgi:hypothetical protein
MQRGLDHPPWCSGAEEASGVGIGVEVHVINIVLVVFEAMIFEPIR